MVWKVEAMAECFPGQYVFESLKEYLNVLLIINVLHTYHIAPWRRVCKASKIHPTGRSYEVKEEDTQCYSSDCMIKFVC